jgi:hypothetical protein
MDIYVSSQHQEDWEIVAKLWRELSKPIDLLEPFTRIVDALQEAHPSSKAA